jgi:[ribosomal protein S5]-alanine N-acetyltransferase
MTRGFDFSYFPQLETERLLLREIVRDDVPALYALFSDPEVTRYNDVETFTQEEDAHWVIDFLRERFDSQLGLRWAICFRSDPAVLIGTCGYNAWLRRNNCGEIGYDLMTRYWNQGITTEAVRAILRFGFEKMALNRVEADVTTGNEASARVLVKLGFMEEGLLRQRGYWKGRYHDLRFFSLLRHEFAG